MFFQSIETVDSGTYLEGPPENAKVSWLLRRGSRYGALGKKIMMGGPLIARELQQSSCYSDTPIVSTCTSARVRVGPCLCLTSLII